MREILDARGYVPRTCTWELTLRCNLRCRHCGSAAGQPRDAEMPQEVSLRVIRELAAAGCRRVTLSGGEPTLSPDWEAIASEGARAGVHVNMIVNAAHHDRAFVRRARDSGLVGIAVSLDGTEAAHDEIRGRRGLYGRVLRLLGDCAAEGLRVGVVTTIWKGNRHQLEELHDLLVGRVSVWQLQLGVAMGNLGRDDQIAPADLLELVPAIATLVRRRRVNIVVADSIGYYGPDEEVLRGHVRPVPCWVGCLAGCRHVGIEADGGVKGCLGVQSVRATEGNLQRESLDAIWRRPGAFAYNRQFAVDQLTGFCRTCLHAETCRGGCYAMRTAEGGDNPFCYHRVATLAERRGRGRQRRVARALAPAALLALVAAGCGGDDDSPPADAPWFFPADAYGITPPDAGPDAWCCVDAYGSTVDASATGPTGEPGGVRR